MWEWIASFGKWIMEGDPRTHGNKLELDPPKILPPDTRLHLLPEFKKWGMKYGVEILNDNETSFGFVIELLQEHFQMTKNQALETAMNIHRNGGVLLKTRSSADAIEIAERANRNISAVGSVLVLRAFGYSDDV